jgi:hypothetical protein
MTDEQVQKSRLQFPICDTADAFDRAAKLAGTRPMALGLIHLTRRVTLASPSVDSDERIPRWLE